MSYANSMILAASLWPVMAVTTLLDLFYRQINPRQWRIWLPAIGSAAWWLALGAGWITLTLGPVGLHVSPLSRSLANEMIAIGILSGVIAVGVLVLSIRSLLHRRKLVRDPQWQALNAWVQAFLRNID